MRPHPRLLAGLTLLTLLLAACAPAAPSPTAPPPKPTEAPKPAAKPTEAPKPAAKPTEAPKPAAKPTEAPAAKPTEKPAAKPAAKPEDIRVPKPSGNLQFKQAFPSTIGFTHLALVLTTERLNKEGWKIEDVFFAQSELAIESVSKGDTPVGNGASNAVLTAIEKGAKLALVAERAPNEWLVAAKTEIKSCADLNGKRLAIHSEGAVSTAMVKQWVNTACKGTPDYIIIPGSENRAAALINGQIDASPLELADWLDVNAKAPGRFHVVENFSRGLPDLATTPIFVNTDWAEKNKDVAVAWLAEVLKTHRMVRANPQLLEDATRRLIPATDPKAIPEIIKAYQGINAFDPNGGLTPTRVQGTIKFFTDAGVIKPGMAAEKAAALNYLEEALKIIGRQ